MNPGLRLQREWRWNARPLRVRVTLLTSGTWRPPQTWEISWLRWSSRSKRWATWRSYRNTGALCDVIQHYRSYAAEWRGLDT